MARGILEIDGRRIELTDEQVEELLKGKSKEACFKRSKNQSYYYINARSEVCSEKDSDRGLEKTLYSSANYCTDKKLMQQRALHEILDRLLWRFSMENNGDKIDWNDECQNKYKILFNYQNNKFIIENNQYIKHNTIYFHKEKIAKRAIKEIIEPFMKEHPEFVW